MFFKKNNFPEKRSLNRAHSIFDARQGFPLFSFFLIISLAETATFTLSIFPGDRKKILGVRAEAQPFPSFTRAVQLDR